MRFSYLSATIFSVFIPGLALAESPGTLGLLSTTKLVAEVRRTTGKIPGATLSIDSERWSQISIWLQLTGGLTSRSSDTDLGTQVGVEWSLKLGHTPSEVESFHAGEVVGFAGSLALAFRTLAWGGWWPGAVIVLAGGELGAGGGHWWSDTARFTFFGGTRVVSGSRDGAGSLELTYVLAPFEFGGSPGGMKSRRVEHRIGLTGAIENIGLGAWFYGIVQSVRLEGRQDYLSAGGTGFGGTFEVRF